MKILYDVQVSFSLIYERQHLLMVIIFDPTTLNNFIMKKNLSLSISNYTRVILKCISQYVLFISFISIKHTKQKIKMFKRKKEKKMSFSIDTWQIMLEQVRSTKIDITQNMWKYYLSLSGFNRASITI